MTAALSTSGPISSEGAVPRAPELAEAAREFEGFLVGALLRVGTRPVAGPTPLDGGSAGRMYREMLYQETARLAAARGDFGVASLLERQARGPQE